jgi:hypothetical protein
MNSSSCMALSSTAARRFECVRLTGAHARGARSLQVQSLQRLVVRIELGKVSQGIALHAMIHLRGVLKMHPAQATARGTALLEFKLGVPRQHSWHRIEVVI